MTKKIILSVFLVLMVVPLHAQGSSSVKQAKTAELNTLLKSKGWTISDIAKYIPYNIAMVDASFNLWLKTKDIVFYKTIGGQSQAVMPADIDGNIKAGYKNEVAIDIPAGYFNAWRDFFAGRCRQHGSAEYILKDYQEGKISFIDCISRIKTSEDIKSYTAYMRDFVLYVTKKESNAWNSLYISLGDISKKNKKIGLCFAAMLCRTTNEPAKWIAVCKQMPSNKYYYGCGDEAYKAYQDYNTQSGINPVKGEYGGCLSGINTYIDGRIVMRNNNISIPITSLKRVEKESYCLDKYKGQDYTFLYNPKGNHLYGFLKKKGDHDYKLQPCTPTLWGQMKNIRELSSLTFALVIRSIMKER